MSQRKRRVRVTTTTFPALTAFRDYVEGRGTLDEYRKTKLATQHKTEVFEIDDNGDWHAVPKAKRSRIMVWAFVALAVLVVVFSAVVALKLINEHDEKVRLDAAWRASAPPPRNQNADEVE